MQSGENQNRTIKTVPNADFAIHDNTDEGQLRHLDVLRSKTQFGVTPLKGLHCIVVGAGPAGLIFAKFAAEQGAAVTVIEKAGDPRKHRAGYTNRSFNITIEDVGRHVLGDHDAWQSGIWLAGRAVHNYQGSGKIHLAKYGASNDRTDDLISIPRSRLRRNLVNLAVNAGATVHFWSHVIHVDPDEGSVEYKDGDSRKHQLSADLVVVCDGLHSIGNALLERHNEFEDIYLKDEPRSYVIARIKQPGELKLSLQHIHFWHQDGREAWTSGIPNGDGSVSLLLASEYADFDINEYPFATKEQTKKLLKKDFRHLYESAGDQLVEQLPRRTRGYFKFKAVPSYIVGDKCVLAGDAACAMPPWAGFGANNAMYGAASLVYQLARKNGNTGAALSIYQAQQLSLTQKLHNFVQDEGDFLANRVTDNPTGRSDAKKRLSMLIREAQIDAATALADSQKVPSDITEKFAASEI